MFDKFTRAHLNILIKIILDHGKIPVAWNNGMNVPEFKPDSENKPNSYRDISILNG